MSASRLTVSVLVAALVSGCGLFVPDQHEFYEAKSNDIDFVNLIFTNIKCELQKGVQDIVEPEGKPVNPNAQWLRKWGTKVTLRFTTAEDSSLNPAAAFTPPPPFSWSIGFGGTAKATVDEQISFTHAFADLLVLPRQRSCVNENGIQIQSDLRIGDWIFKQVKLATIPGTLPGALSIDNSSYTITFVASYGADATPTWTFKRVTVNPRGRFLALSRSKTSTLTLTLAHIVKTGDEEAPVSLDDQGLIAHDLQVLGQAVGAANQAFQR